MNKRGVSMAVETAGTGVLFEGTQVPMQTLFEYLKRGKTLIDFLRDFPNVGRSQALKALELAADRDRLALRFEEKPDLDQLALEHCVQAAADFDSLLGDFWPEDESADDFVAQLRSWRKESGTTQKP
jgi:uncharacterized protein (DUF433 family)